MRKDRGIIFGVTSGTRSAPIRINNYRAKANLPTHFGRMAKSTSSSQSDKPLYGMRTTKVRRRR